MEAGWLSTYWHFSFDKYYDPGNVSFGPLRVFNDDTVQPGGGWGMHPHRDMEIITYVVRGRIEHRDSSGGGGVVREGEVQCMTAGTGIVHSEFNPSKDEPLRFLQVWITPERQGLHPSYETKHFTKGEQRGKLLAVASGRPVGKAARIHQDATLHVATLEGDGEVEYRIHDGRRGYLFTIDGSSSLGGDKLGPRDVARIVGPEDLTIGGSNGTEVILIDLP